jgi:hypothetical protein
MKIIVDIHDEAHPGDPMLRIESDGEGRYQISGRNLPRQDGKRSYETEDGLHVLGLIQLVFGANDSREYLTRRLKQHDEEVTISS